MTWCGHRTRSPPRIPLLSGEALELARLNVLVGTLACGEGDLPSCLRALREQDHPFEHVLIENQTEAEAHRRLYRRFHESDADILVKVDADMVLVNAGIVRFIVGRMEETGSPNVLHMVDDFFTCRPIGGLLTVTQEMRYDIEGIGEHDLYPDRRYAKAGLGKEELAARKRVFGEVVARHAHECTDLQAFHYGYHRWLKQQYAICARVGDCLRAYPHETRRGWACLGMVAASEHPDPRAASYGAALDALAAQAGARVHALDVPGILRLLELRLRRVGHAPAGDGGAADEKLRPAIVPA